MRVFEQHQRHDFQQSLERAGLCDERFALPGHFAVLSLASLGTTARTIRSLFDVRTGIVANDC